MDFIHQRYKKARRSRSKNAWYKPVQDYAQLYKWLRFIHYSNENRITKVDNVLLTNYYSQPIYFSIYLRWTGLWQLIFATKPYAHLVFFYIQLYGKYWSVARICSQQWRSRNVRAKISHARIKVSLLLCIFLLLLHHSWAWILTNNDIISLMDG